MADEQTPAAEDNGESTPTPVDLNKIAATESQPDEGMEIVNCPKCDKPRRKFVILDGECDSCRTAGQPAAIVDMLGWPEVRARRDRLIADTDWTQLADVSDEISVKYSPIRQRLRDITEETEALQAWYKLDQITVELAK